MNDLQQTYRKILKLDDHTKEAYKDEIESYIQSIYKANKVPYKPI